MFSKDSLKNKKHNVIAVLMSVLLSAGIVIGCSSTAEDPGGSEAIAAEKSTEVVETEEPAVVAEEVDESVESVDILDREKPKELGYYEQVKDGGRTEIRYEDGLINDPLATNKWLMIEEVANLGRDETKVKGTLYEVFYCGKPDNDLVYFPGDELPEGYEVKETEDYEVILWGEDHDNGMGDVYGSGYTAEKDASNKISYKYHPACNKYTNDVDPDLGFMTYDDSEYIGKALEPGMYGLLYLNTHDFDWDDEGPRTSTLFVQALLKDQMPTDGTEVSDNVMHQ
ncbi:MAG: hypothetical protein IJU43_03875 [Lachnospiraceae bacterium]|nr:hypothetical protein [Lachnospiraceae bacterium]